MKILIADDDPTSRLLLKTLLTRWGYQPMSVADGNEAWKILRGPDGPRLAVLDRMMPGIQGDEICRRVRRLEENEERYTYLILLTAKGSADHIISGIEAGADDYIQKPFDERELRVRIRVGQRVVHLHSDLVAAKQEYWLQSRTDPLTGALNRRELLPEVERELGRTKRGGREMSLSLLDIDHFKEVNDVHGHLAGDAVLRECVRRIGDVTRAYDSLGRIGGEEFLILFPDTGESEAMTVCNRIREVIAEEPVNFGGAAIRVTVSQGVLTSDGEDDIDHLIKLADQAMYRAKRKGRNRVELMDWKSYRRG